MLSHGRPGRMNITPGEALMGHYLSSFGGRVLATTLFTGALLLGLVIPSAAGDFVLWTGVFTADGECKVTAIDQFSTFLPSITVGDKSCAQLMAAIQLSGEGVLPDPLDCEQSTRSHIEPRRPDDFFTAGERMFRVGVTGEARCERQFPTQPTGVP